jgi:UDP-N-acetyl-2-amino-2-deoxyglucuronate dehydrogenase
MTKDLINFAIVGCGVIGPMHALAISELPAARVAAVCDIDAAKARALAERCGAEAYTDYAAMLLRRDVDVVVVATPSGLHADMGIAAARSGKHVIVEKPMDVSLAKADSLTAACREAGVKLSVMSQHRFDPAVEALRQAVAASELGALNFGAAHTKWWRAQEYYDSADWRGTRALDGGGALINQSIHYVDLLQYIMGPVAEVSAYAANRVHVRIEVEDVVLAAVKFKSGALGLIEGNTAAFPGLVTRLDIYGTDGLVVIENDLVKEWRLRSGAACPAAADSGTVIAGTSSANIWHISHRRQIQDMIDAIRQDRLPRVDGAEGRKPLEIVLAVYESARTGKPVRLG